MKFFGILQLKIGKMAPQLLLLSAKSLPSNLPGPDRPEGFQ